MTEAGKKWDSGYMPGIEIPFNIPFRVQLKEILYPDEITMLAQETYLGFYNLSPLPLTIPRIGFDWDKITAKNTASLKSFLEGGTLEISQALNNPIVMLINNPLWRPGTFFDPGSCYFSSRKADITTLRAALGCCMLVFSDKSDLNPYYSLYNYEPIQKFPEYRKARPIGRLWLAPIRSYAAESIIGYTAWNPYSESGRLRLLLKTIAREVLQYPFYNPNHSLAPIMSPSTPLPTVLPLYINGGRPTYFLPHNLAIRSSHFFDEPVKKYYVTCQACEQPVLFIDSILKDGIVACKDCTSVCKLCGTNTIKEAKLLLVLLSGVQTVCQDCKTHELVRCIECQRFTSNEHIYTLPSGLSYCLNCLNYCPFCFNAEVSSIRHLSHEQWPLPVPCQQCIRKIPLNLTNLENNISSIHRLVEMLVYWKTDIRESLKELKNVKKKKEALKKATKLSSPF